MNKFETYVLHGISSSPTYCKCPTCNKIHRKYIEKDYINSEYNWKAMFGYFLIVCDDCLNKVGVYKDVFP